MAEGLLYFGASDVLSSSPWPARRGEILANLLAPAADAGWRTFAHSPVVPSTEPFVSHAWGNCTVAAGAGTGARRQVVIWLTDQHSVISGEFVALLRGRLAAEFRVRFHRQSVSLYCHYHGVCASDGRVKWLLRHPRIHEVREGAGFLDGFEQVERVSRDIGRLARTFWHLFRTRLRAVDVFFCSIPVYWCRLYEHMGRPILALMDQPVFLFVPPPQRLAWLLQLRELAEDKRNLFVCQTAFLRAQVEWQVGLRLPVVRYPAVRMQRWSYRPSGSAARSALVVSQLPHRPYFLPLLRQFQALNSHLAAVRLVGLEELPAWRHNRKDRYQRIAEHRQAIVFPYDVHFIKFLEIYGLGVPMLLPADFYMWAFSWTIADPDVMDVSLAADLRRAEGDAPPKAPPWPHPFPPFCATRGLRHVDPAACHYWAGLSDLARLPHLRYFDSLPDLLAQVVAADHLELGRLSGLMRQFQAKSVAEVAAFWRRALAALLAGDTGQLLGLQSPPAAPVMTTSGRLRNLTA